MKLSPTIFSLLLLSIPAINGMQKEEINRVGSSLISMGIPPYCKPFLKKALQTHSLEKAAEKICKFATQDKTFNTIMNSKQHAFSFVTFLAQHFTHNELITAAEALKTPTAQQWAKEQLPPSLKSTFLTIIQKEATISAALATLKINFHDYTMAQSKSSSLRLSASSDQTCNEHVSKWLIAKLAHRYANLNELDIADQFAEDSFLGIKRPFVLSWIHQRAEELEDESLLLNAAEDHNIRSLRQLASKGVDINACYKSDGSTALIRSVMIHDTALMQELLTLGANRHTVDKHGESALAWAKKNGHNDMVILLQDHTEEPKEKCSLM